MKIRDKKTGLIVSVPSYQEDEVRKAIAAGIDPMSIIGNDKARNGRTIKGRKAKNSYNTNYQDMFDNRNPNQIKFTPRDEGQEPNVIDLYQTPQSYIQGVNPQQQKLSFTPRETDIEEQSLNNNLNLMNMDNSSVYEEPVWNEDLSKQIGKYNLSKGRNPDFYTPDGIKKYKENKTLNTFKPNLNFTPITGNKFFDRAMKFKNNANNYAFDAIDNLMNDSSNLMYNGNLGIPQIGKIRVNNKKVDDPSYFGQNGIILPENENSQNVWNWSSVIKQRPQEPTFQMESLPIQQLTESPQSLEPNLNKVSVDNEVKNKNVFRNANTALNFVGAGVNDALAGISFGMGALDMIGNNRQNKMVQEREAKMFTQSVFNNEEFSTPYESRGYGNLGRNALAENGLQIKEIGGIGQPNIEAEHGEIVQTPEGFSQMLQGKTHEEGGIHLNLKPNTKILSDHLKEPITKKSYAKLAKPFETKKDFDRLNNKRANNPIQKTTAEMLINMKNNKLDELFAKQEQDKIMGKHGLKVQLETLSQEMENPMTQDLPMAKKGITVPGMMSNNAVIGTNKSNSGGVPNKYPKWTSEYYNDLNNYLKKLGYKGVDLENAKHEIYQRIVSGDQSINSPITQDLIPDLIRQQKMGLTNKHRDMLKKAGIKNADKIADFSELKSADFEKLQKSINKKDFDLDADFITQGYLDNLRGHRGVRFKPENITPAQAKEKYGKNPFFYNNDDLNKMLFNLTQGEYGEPILHYPELIDPATGLPNYGQGLNNPEIQYKDREVIKNQYLQPNIEANMNIPLYLPNNYGREPLNFYNLNPEFIDPRYLDVQPQLNQVTRGVRDFQNNLGSRSSSDMSNMLQSQVNAYNQNQNIYGQKYNYDRQQDAQAQQFNAQAVMNVDRANQSAWFQQLEDPIRYRESSLDEQIRTDNQSNIQNANNQYAFYNNLDYIRNEMPYYKNLLKEEIINSLGLAVDPQDPYKEVTKKTTKKSGDITETVTEKKMGGKVKLKLKRK